MAHLSCGAPLLYSNGAPCLGAPLLVLTSNGALSTGAPVLSFFQKKIQKNINFFILFFKTSNGAPWMWCAITSLASNGALSPGAPLLVLKKNKKICY